MPYRIEYTPPSEVELPLNLWANPKFMLAVQKLHQLEALHLRCYKGEQLVALLPVYEKRLLSYRMLKSPGGSYYQGLNLWLYEKSLSGRKLLDTLQIIQCIAISLRERYKKVQINLCPGTDDVRGFTWEKLTAKPLYTFVHDFSAPPVPLPDERRKLALAAKQNFHFAEELDTSGFMELFSAMNSRKNRDISFTYVQFEQFIHSLHVQGLLRQYNLYQEDAIVSSNILLMDADKFYTVFRATASEALKNGASSLHTMQLIESLAGNINSLDFCGANVPEVARFKAALGLKLQVFYQISL
ncbi:MAG: GNAT family N-acetyltransferase [Candidatus Cloacimonas sp.]|jgi:hypothetical protein|nr:GNAT family N-acetyltransferase [Candidatus Cloacimonas sp.]